MLHALKTEQAYYFTIADGTKPFEVRKFDRPFKIGDEICLQEWDALNKIYTGSEWYGKITYILEDERFCKKGYCILGIKKKESDY